MAQAKLPKAQVFDTLVIGGGLSGLLAANALADTGQNVALIEASDALGGSCRAGFTAAGAIDYGLKLFPVGEASETALAWLEQQLGEKIERTELEAAPVTYDDGKFKPYVGFGDAAVHTGSEIEAYALQKRLILAPAPKDWVQTLASRFKGAVFLQSQVTQLVLEHGQVTEAIVNGSKRFSAREVIFAAAPSLLPALLGDAALPARIRQKLVKGEMWTSVNLDIAHTEAITDSASVHVLKGANEEPCVGVFHPAVRQPDGQSRQVSQWLTLIPRDQIDEEELVAGALKHIKRQVKRAYASALEGVLQERILVVPASHGHLSGVADAAGTQLPKIENLWLASALIAPSRNTLGALQQVRAVVDAIIAPNARRELTERKETLAPEI